MKRSISMLALLSLMTAGSTAVAEDAHTVDGTEQEQHAERLFTGVFGQCRPASAGAVDGTVALVFTVRADGTFGATSTFKEEEGRDELRNLVQCMGERAQQARPFPKSSANMTIGVKFQVYAEDGLLKLGSGETETLGTTKMFQWARQAVSADGVRPRN